MSHLPKSVQKLIEEFEKLPGIGQKTAHRLVFYLLSKADSDLKNFGESLIHLKDKLVTCSICFNIATQDPCPICSDSKRDKSLVMVVEEPLDVISLERTQFSGHYHVLGGVVSPIDGIGPDDLRIKQLLDRVSRDTYIKEVILATDPSLEGEATALYIAKKIGDNHKTKITRLARGLPVGGDLEYADELTLTRALEGRKEF